jgi:transcriptional regulator with PAS, ATPase and Fis domain
MIPDTQSKLLRVLQERTVRAVGSTREVPVNVRLIASTNRNPDEAVNSGLLRADLYYRLQASVLRIAPLRKRLEDVEPLVEHFIAVLNERGFRATPVVGINEGALEAMSGYLWPGNVRELANAVETAFTFGKSPEIRLDDLPESISGQHQAAGLSGAPGPLGSFADAERDLVRRALESAAGNKVSAAKMLKISRKRLYAKIAKYHLQ